MVQINQSMAVVVQIQEHVALVDAQAPFHTRLRPPAPRTQMRLRAAPVVPPRVRRRPRIAWRHHVTRPRPMQRAAPPLKPPHIRRSGGSPVDIMTREVRAHVGCRRAVEAPMRCRGGAATVAVQQGLLRQLRHAEGKRIEVRQRQAKGLAARRRSAVGEGVAVATGYHWRCKVRAHQLRHVAPVRLEAHL